MSNTQIKGERMDTLVRLIVERAQAVVHYNSDRKACGNELRQEAWQEVVASYNKKYPDAPKSEKQVKKAFAAKKSSVKKDEALLKRYRSQTGGGVDLLVEEHVRRVTKDFGEAEGLILMLCARTPAFAGVEGGAESGERAAAHTKRELKVELPKKRKVKEDGEEEEEDTRPPEVAYVGRLLAPARRQYLDRFVALNTDRMRARAAALQEEMAPATKRKKREEAAKIEEEKRKKEEEERRGEMAAMRNMMSEGFKSIADVIRAALPLRPAPAVSDATPGAPALSPLSPIVDDSVVIID